MRLDKITMDDLVNVAATAYVQGIAVAAEILAKETRRLSQPEGHAMLKEQIKKELGMSAPHKKRKPNSNRPNK